MEEVEHEYAFCLRPWAQPLTAVAATNHCRQTSRSQQICWQARSQALPYVPRRDCAEHALTTR